MHPAWFPQRSAADGPVAVLKNLVHHAGAPVTHTGIERAVKSHPAFPHFSLAAFAQVLDAWRFRTLPVQIGPADLPRLYYPAIAYLPADGGAFVVLCRLQDGQVAYIHPARGWIRESTDAFAAKWAGMALLAIPTKGCGEPGYAEKRQAEVARQQGNPALRKVQRLENFLSGEECDHIVNFAAPLFAPSQVINDRSAEVHQGRTSYSAMLKETNDPVLDAIYRRASAAVGIGTEYFEYGQCVSYAPGQEYRAHFDTLDESSPLGKEKMARYGQRRITLLVYLNDDFEGGETYFPVLDYKIEPQKGTAVLFPLLGQDNRPDPDALHAGLPVFSGRKYALNLWVWTKPFRKDGIKGSPEEGRRETGGWETGAFNGNSH